MARTVCPMTKRKRYEEELYGTHCVSDDQAKRYEEALYGTHCVSDVQAKRYEEELYGTHCVWQRSAAATRQGRALDVEQKTCTMCGIFCHSQSRCTALTEEKKKCLSILREDIKCPRA